MPTSHAPPAPTAVAPPPRPRRRFTTADVAQCLDMLVIGDVCVGISVDGYRTIVRGFLTDPAGSLAALLAALAQGAAPQAVQQHAHAVKGAASSIGLRALHELAREIEQGAEQRSADDNQALAERLRERSATTQALCERMGLA